MLCVHQAHRLIYMTHEFLCLYLPPQARQAAAAACFQPTFRASPALLNLRRIESALAQQRQFAKAREAQRRADALQAGELAAQASSLDARQRMEDARVAERQAREQEALAARLALAADEARLKRAAELEGMRRRQQALMQAAQRDHARERQQAEGSLRGALGIKRPANLLALPSIGTSIASTPLLSSPKTRAASVAGTRLQPQHQEQLLLLPSVNGTGSRAGTAGRLGAAELARTPYSTVKAGRLSHPAAAGGEDDSFFGVAIARHAAAAAGVDTAHLGGPTSAAGSEQPSQHAVAKSSSSRSSSSSSSSSGRASDSSCGAEAAGRAAAVVGGAGLVEETGGGEDLGATAGGGTTGDAVDAVAPWEGAESAAAVEVGDGR